ncbi:SOS-induced cell division inhibitor SulA [Siccibacter turicensis]|uniref:Cell division inhibitor SulA n=1 Tax=Siccibacter turicensis TaxID=357233 RepID=A0A2P8VRN6_9ENTR|nr:SOS-induced cell division inhibitor SulA [Siccibacter turicensis]PSN09718.1 cell division inhibitor SulA [Siccibacter turicensis]
MYLSGYEKHVVRTQSLSQDRASSSDDIRGMISEVVYREDQPWVTQMVLLPLLQQLGKQSRWQLWLTPQQKLSRAWVETAGLPLTKVMQVSQMAPEFTVETMARALRTGNYSVVIGWLPHELSREEQQLLTEAAEMGSAIGFIMRPMQSGSLTQRPLSGLKIHSSLYH